MNDWDSLILKLAHDFLVDDYDQELWHLIKSRKQKADESVIIFVSVMESLFKRLSIPAVASTRIRWIVRNLKPEYVKYLALEKFNTVEDLIKATRKLEIVCLEHLDASHSNINSH